MAKRTLADSISIAATLALVFNVYRQGVGATTFTVVNQCSETVWPAGFPVGGGTKLEQRATWTVDVPAGTASARFWGRTGCSFDASGRGSCTTGDCGGALSCTLSGQPDTTLVEYTLGNSQDFYDISVIDGYNLALSLTLSDGSCYAPVCNSAQCPDAYQYPTDDTKTRSCPSGATYKIVFCP